MSKWKHDATEIVENGEDDFKLVQYESYLDYSYAEIPCLIALLQDKWEEKMGKDEGWIANPGRDPEIKEPFEVKLENGTTYKNEKGDTWYWNLTGPGAIAYYRILKPQGIHNLKWLQEFTKEAETNKEPWKSFEIRSIGGTQWVPLSSAFNFLIFWDKNFEVRRKPQKQKVWQWLYRRDRIFETTNQLYRTKEEAHKGVFGDNYAEGYEILRPIEESEEEIEDNHE